MSRSWRPLRTRRSSRTHRPRRSRRPWWTSRTCKKIVGQHLKIKTFGYSGDVKWFRLVKLYMPSIMTSLEGCPFAPGGPGSPRSPFSPASPFSPGSPEEDIMQKKLQDCIHALKTLSPIEKHELFSTVNHVVENRVKNRQTSSFS